MKRVTRRGGFTLVELLVTTSIMALVGGTCMATLAGGVNVWQRAMAFGTRDQSVLITLERMRRDVQKIRRFAPLPPEGQSNRYAFAAVDRVDPEAPEEIGQLGYLFDARNRALCRAFLPYRMSRRSRLPQHCRIVLERVVRLRFLYLKADGKWTQSWDESEPPEALKVSIVLDEGEQGTSTHAFVVSLVTVPAGEE